MTKTETIQLATNVANAHQQVQPCARKASEIGQLQQSDLDVIFLLTGVLSARILWTR